MKKAIVSLMVCGFALVTVSGQTIPEKDAAMITMLAGAVSRIGKVNRASYFIVLAGVIFFIISDSVLALDKFVQPVPLSTLIIMGTYIAAQWLITTGYIKQHTREIA